MFNRAYPTFVCIRLFASIYGLSKAMNYLPYTYPVEINILKSTLERKQKARIKCI